MASWTVGKAKTSGNARVLSEGKKPTLASASKSSKTASVRTTMSAAPVSRPSPQPTATPTAQPIATTQESAYTGINAPFFSLEGQKQRFRNIYEVGKIALNPFSQERIVSTTGSRSANAVIEAVANHPYITAGIAAGGITAARSAPAALAGLRSPAVPAATAAATATRANSLRPLGIAAAGGLAAGLLFMRGSAPQDTTQAASQSGYSSPTNTTTQYDYSQRQTYQDQYTANTIRGSPGARIGSSQGQLVDQPSSLSAIPSITAPFDQGIGQSASQSQAGDFLLPALLIGAALILSR